MEDADDYKAQRNFNFSKRNVTAICRAFLDTIKPLDCGVYASYSWLQDILIGGAQFAPSGTLNGAPAIIGYIWQFTDKFQIGGKYFDGNILYD